jgi:DNA polymerase-3 subunit epsilon
VGEMTREIVLDTETTGLSPHDGHKLVEIGCIELVNHIPTGNVFHRYINPNRSVPIEAYNVHGLSTEFLKDFSPFAHIVEEFLAFIQEDTLIIHNASFDMGFLNFELQNVQRESLMSNKVVDTLKIARKKFPGSPASLDALCRRFKIDTTSRTKHGAIIDCELLAEVYLELIGGRQKAFDMGTISPVEVKSVSDSLQTINKKIRREPREFVLSEEETDAHRAFMEQYIHSK